MKPRRREVRAAPISVILSEVEGPLRVSELHPEAAPKDLFPAGNLRKSRFGPLKIGVIRGPRDLLPPQPSCFPAGNLREPSLRASQNQCHPEQTEGRRRRISSRGEPSCFPAGNLRRSSHDRRAGSPTPALPRFGRREHEGRCGEHEGCIRQVPPPSPPRARGGSRTSAFRIGFGMSVFRAMFS